MNWKSFLATFWLIFLAELGDKTQLAVILQSAVHGRAVVMLAASLALVLSVVLGVFVGGLLTKMFSERVIHGIAGILFLVFGVLMLHAAIRPGPDVEPVVEAARGVTPQPDDLL